CVHNSCRSQIAECLGKLLASDVFESYSAGSKTFDTIPEPDIAISMGCDVGCPYIGKSFDDNWGLPDPTGESDEIFLKTIQEIKEKVLALKNQLQDEEV
ncbi:MAG: arsenate reductase ArsC, partial [Agathobacter sp.]